MPLILLIFLMLLVVISGMVGSEDMPQYPDERDKHNDIFPHLDTRGPHEGQILVIPIVSGPSADVDTFLENNIEESEEIVLRLADVIARLNEEGKDVSELEQKASNYSALVAEARDYITMAESSSSEADRQKYLELSRESIIRANDELKPIFGIIKAHLPGPVPIGDNDVLVAQGSGIAILSGDLDASIFISTGKFSAVDFSGDLLIDMEYEFDQEAMPDRAPSGTLIKPQNTYSYVGVTGNVSLSGSAFSIAVMAEDMEISVSGTGEAELIGNGTYYLDGVSSDGNENVWAGPIFDNN